MSLVAAATAPAGRSIVDLLLDAGRAVRALTRDAGQAGLLPMEGVSGGFLSLEQWAADDPVGS